MRLLRHYLHENTNITLMFARALYWHFKQFLGFCFVNRRLKMSGLHANEKFKVAFIDMGGVVGE